MGKRAMLPGMQFGMPNMMSYGMQPGMQFGMQPGMQFGMPNMMPQQPTHTPSQLGDEDDADNL